MGAVIGVGVGLVIGFIVGWLTRDVQSRPLTGAHDRLGIGVPGEWHRREAARGDGHEKTREPD
jgi:hypothetical protein